MQRIQKNLALLDEFFAKFPSSFEWVRPKAGTIAFPRLIGDVNSLEFCRRVVEDANIMLLPSTVYDYDSSHVRIGFGRANMAEALGKLEEYLLTALHSG